MTDSFWYPSVDDVLDSHEDVVSEYPATSPGVQRRGDVEFALTYVSEEKGEWKIVHHHADLNAAFAERLRLRP